MLISTRTVLANTHTHTRFYGNAFCRAFSQGARRRSATNMPHKPCVCVFVSMTNCTRLRFFLYFRCKQKCAFPDRGRDEYTFCEGNTTNCGGMQTRLINRMHIHTVCEALCSNVGITTATVHLVFSLLPLDGCRATSEPPFPLPRDRSGGARSGESVVRCD